MVMMGNKKHVLTQILGDPEEGKKEEGNESSLHSCAAELIDAVHNKDVDGLVSALRACISECMGNGGE